MKTPPRRHHFLIALLALATGCASSGSAPPASEAPEAAAGVTSLPPPPPPEAVQDALLPSLGLDPDAVEAPPEPRFDVAVVDAAARDFFMGLVEGTHHNMVLDPAVEGQITLTLKNATIRDVMKAVSDAYGYEYRVTPYGFHVMPAGLHSRIFRVDYLNVARVGSSLTRVSSGQVSDSDTGEGESRASATGVSGSRLDTRSQVDFWQELTRSLEAIIGSGEGRSVVVTPHTGTIVVRATAAELRGVEHYLRSVQQNLTRQVILEAKILEVSLSDDYQAGINWAALVSKNPDIVIGQTGGGTVFEEGESEIAGEEGILDPRVADLVEGTATSAFGGVFTMAVEGSRFVSFIELLETQGDVHVLSSPRIATLSNQKAVIKVGSDEFFVTDVSSTTVTGTATTTSPSIELTPFFSGIALDVTPQVAENGEVILHIHPSVSEVTDQTKRFSVGGDEELALPLALSTIRESDSVVRARSGQMIVIGGLMQNIGHDAHSGIPYLARTPLIGRLFRHEKQSYQKSELVILLRPLVAGNGTWTARLDRAERRLHELRPGAENLLRNAGEY